MFEVFFFKNCIISGVNKFKELIVELYKVRLVVFFRLKVLSSVSNLWIDFFSCDYL